MIKLVDLDLVLTINSTHFCDYRKLEMTKRSSVSDTLFLRHFVQAFAEDRRLTSADIEQYDSQYICIFSLC